jgi:ribonuclease VapC
LSSGVVIDTSALVALLGMEPEAARIAAAMEADATRLVSAATLIEAGIVIEARYGTDGGRDLDLLLGKAGATIEPVTAEQAEVARAAWRRFGRGNHSANLNLGDCFSYALAKTSGEPLLFKGEDFRQTDVAVVTY